MKEQRAGVKYRPSQYWIGPRAHRFFVLSHDESRNIDEEILFRQYCRFVFCRYGQLCSNSSVWITG
ncbi:MAG: hypothetical protein DMG14_14870 [Acidobacteria bacterium]|nr:MAG: hypothetical protein DMG14_14870 [Acidobacteriota bacterium]